MTNHSIEEVSTSERHHNEPTHDHYLTDSGGGGAASGDDQNDEETEEECHLLISNGRLQSQNKLFRKSRRLRSGQSGRADAPTQSLPGAPKQQHHPQQAKPAQARKNDLLTQLFSYTQDFPGRRNLHLHPNRAKARQLLSCALLLFLLISFVLVFVKLVRLVHNGRDQLATRVAMMLDEEHRRQVEAEQAQRWLVSTPQCRIPLLSPWHSSITGYVRVKSPMNCSAVIDAYYSEQEAEAASTPRPPQTAIETLTLVRRQQLFLTRRAVELGALVNDSCCFRQILRSPDSDDQLEYGDACEPIRESPLVFRDTSVRWIEVRCPRWNYTNVHAFVWPTREEADAMAGVAYEQLDADNYYNVLMLGMDTISRLNGLRQLNGSLTLLDELYTKLDFVGYNKVGENTFPNLIPLLTGLTPTQLTKTQCWLTTGYSDDSERGDDFLDNCKYLWNFYQQVGYLTYFSEDWPSASTFNYLKPGFKHEPTSYYGRPFTLARRELLFPKFKSIGCASCQLDQPIVQIDLENLKSFVESHAQKPYFAFHWINCPQHDDLNGASQVDHLVEKFLRDIHELTQNERTFVIFFSDHGYRWNDFVSTRIGHYESSLPLMTISPPRRFIERHPDLYEHMKQHQKALLTPFDMFKSLMGIRDLGLKNLTGARNASASDQPNFHRKRTVKRQSIATPPLANEQPTESPQQLAETTTMPTAVTTIRQLTPLDGVSYKQSFRSLSILSQHNASELDRSCIEAGIPDNYCVCHQFQKISTDTNDVLGAAYYLVYVHLNEVLRNHQQLCYQLDLDKVIEAEFYSLTLAAADGKESKPKRKKSKKKKLENELLTKGGAHSTTTARPQTTGEIDLEIKQNLLPNREYNILFSTKPGTGLFQEVIRFYGDDIEACAAAVEQARKIVEDKWADFKDKHSSVVLMNSVCEFSVHSDSISRLSLYKDESKCVKSNIELKKVCLCRPEEGG